MIRAAVWAVLGAAVVLAARAIAYALAPWQSLALLRLEHKAGGPHVAVLLGAIVALAAAGAAAVLWLAAVAVRERLELELRHVVSRPRLSLTRLAVRAVLLFGTTSLAFAYFESYLHWRAGLGWHGIHCLVGPVHRDAVPILAALSLLAVAAHGAVEHLLSWARRLVALLAARLPVLRGTGHIFSSTARALSQRIEPAAAPRGPPARAFV
jgi:hypothetical protein